MKKLTSLIAILVCLSMTLCLCACGAKTEAPAAAPAAPAVKALPPAPGTAGEVKIYDTDPRDAAMIMAIVADKLQKPLNELRFVSIKEVK